MCFKPGFLGTLVFREGVLRFPCKTDYIFCIMYSVLNNLPVPVIIHNNEYWQYLKRIIRLNGILRKSTVAYIQNTETFEKNNLSTFAIHNVFRETEQTVKSLVSHGLDVNSQFHTRGASVSDCVRYWSPLKRNRRTVSEMYTIFIL